MTLSEFFKENPKIALGFSGGVDSSYLLYEAVRNGVDVKAYFIKTAFQPGFELRDARRIAEKTGVKVTVLEADILSNNKVAENPDDRCYHCKQTLFGILRQRALKDGYNVIIDGTNASDDAGDRPGMKALGELSVRSPLRECDMTKAEIRKRSQEAGLFTWDKPAYACLATRIPAGTRITNELLVKIEASEEVMLSMGFTDFRVRVFGGAARIQLPENQMDKALEKREEINARLKPYFQVILLDLTGR